MVFTDSGISARIWVDLERYRSCIDGPYFGVSNIRGQLVVVAQTTLPDVQGKNDPVFGSFNDVCPSYFLSAIVSQNDIQAGIFPKWGQGEVDTNSPSIRPGFDSEFNEAHI